MRTKETFHQYVSFRKASSTIIEQGAPLRPDLVEQNTRELMETTQALMAYRKFEQQTSLLNVSIEERFLRKRNLNLPMFFVSNEHYQRHFQQDEEDSDDEDDHGLMLGVENTGLPALRHFLKSIPMDDVYRRMEAYLHGFRGFVEALRSTVDKRPTEDPETLARILDRFRSQIHTASLEDALQMDTVEVFTSSMKKARWIGEASIAIDEMDAWSAASVKSGVKKRGVHKIKDEPTQRNWNMRFSDPSKSSIKSAFRLLWKDSKEHITEYKKSLGDACAQMQQDILSKSGTIGYHTEPCLLAPRQSTVGI